MKVKGMDLQEKEAQKSCNLSEKRVDLPQEKGSGTS